MRPFTLTLSHPYKGMRERSRKQAEEGTTLLGVGWSFRSAIRDETNRTNRTNRTNKSVGGALVNRKDECATSV